MGVGLGYVRLKLSARSLVSSICCCWSSPTGTCVALSSLNGVNVSCITRPTYRQECPQLAEWDK